jgi:hypothetical protein
LGRRIFFLRGYFHQIPREKKNEKWVILDFILGSALFAQRLIPVFPT